MAYSPDPHLSFSLARATDAHLTFGAADAPVSAVGKCTVSVKLPALRASVQLGYDNMVARGVYVSFTTPLQAGEWRGHDQAHRLDVTPVIGGDVGLSTKAAHAFEQPIAQSVGKLEQRRAWISSVLQPSIAIGFDACESFESAIRALLERALAWQAGQALSIDIGERWQEMYRYGLTASGRFQSAMPVNMQRESFSHPGAVYQVDRALRWQAAWPPRPGKSWLDPGVEPPKPDGCYIRSGHLTFKWPALRDGHITFICDNALAPGEPKRVVPIRSAYIVINNVTLIRVDTGRELVCEALDISVDADSWTCAWSATLAWSEFDALRAERGQPVELLASINGHSYKLLMEGAPSRQRSFGKWGVSIRGRGIAAALDSPYQDVSVRSNPTQAMTAQQLMADALTINGVSNGWALDWQITDWLVPAGAWSHQGTPIAAVLEVASAVSAIVQAADAAKILRILPRYPIKPWEWATANPDIQIPLDIVTTDSIEPSIKPAYNAVFVGGQSYGVTALVKRQGTAADVLAQTITHPLLTASEATLQRGLAILGDTGAQERIGMSLPLSDDTGLIRVNMLADVPDPDDPWRGLVRGVALSAKWQEQGGLEVWQNINLERHYA